MSSCVDTVRCGAKLGQVYDGMWLHDATQSCIASTAASFTQNAKRLRLAPAASDITAQVIVAQDGYAATDDTARDPPLNTSHDPPEHATYLTRPFPE
jgi:hypothetical protein